MFTNNQKSVFARFVLILILTAGMLGVKPAKPVLAASAWYVSPTGNDLNSCSSTGNPCATINGALGKASAGDTIEVAIGTYTGTGTEVVLIDKSITLSGGWDANFTTQSGLSTIDGQATRGGIVVSAVGTIATVDYFKVQNGLSCNAGGIYINYGTTLTLNNALISNNHLTCTGSGGGISNDGTTIINNSIIKDNNPSGGISNWGKLTMNNSTISGNYSNSSPGGGLQNAGIATLNNSTVSGNTAENNGGGGIANLQGLGTLILNNSTIIGNIALRSDGGGLLNKMGTTVTMQNTILAMNTATIYPTNAVISSDCSGGHSGPYINPCVLNSSGYNLIGNNSGITFSAATGDLVGTSSNPIDPRLSPLQNNGGATPTHALMIDSPALNAGNPAIPGSGGNACLATDQRGVTRPQGGHCDIGAYEVNYLTISGNVGMPGVTLNYIDKTFKTVTTDGSGNYSVSVPIGWSGTVTPSKVGYNFSPVSRNYINMSSIQVAQNYVATSVPPGIDTTGVFRPSNGLLYLKNFNTTGFADVAINYGMGGDYPVTGDWDGNGTATIGIYRNASFYLRNSNTLGFADLVFAFGQPGDQPVAGDWNGDGIDTIGIYRPSTGQFLLRNSNSAGVADYSFYLGIVGDVGIAGDWTNQGFDTVGVFRPSNGVIFLKNKNQTGFADIALNYGLAGDQPVTGDWNGDGKDTIGVYRNGRFLLRNSNTIGYADIAFYLGNPGDMPIAGNWDGIP
jgi:hypothetical protein